MRRRLWIALVGMAVVGVGCSDDENPNIPWPDGGPEEASIFLDSTTQDLGQVPDGLPVDPEGPTIEVLVPAEDEIVIGTVLKVRASVTDSDGVDDQSVEVTLQGQDEGVKMSITTTPNVYEALLDIAEYKDKVRLWVVASDLLGNKNSAVVNFVRDPGPTILFTSPAEDSRHKKSVSVQVSVADKTTVEMFEVKIGSHTLDLTATPRPNQTDYAGTVKFDDPAFGIPLSGKQVLTATAVNANGAKSTAQRIFYIDDEGPQITVTSPEIGQLVGGIVKIEAKVEDLAGVLESSVKCVIGNELDQRTVLLFPDASAKDVYVGQFDTRTLDDNDLWPVVSFRAADKLGNEAHYDIEVAVDNGQPIISLDPPTDYHHAKKEEGIWQCSQPFDPVGDDAASDGEIVPQITTFRARIEDQGNGSTVPSAEWVPVADIEEESVYMYVLDDTNKPLVVDTTGDGYCDSINPEIVPVAGNPVPGEAVAVKLSPVQPAGGANFVPMAGDPPPPCSTWGTQDDPPDELCYTTLGPPLFGGGFGENFTVASAYLCTDRPILWSIPPVVGGDEYKCTGIPFDFIANEFSDGWVCAAIEAKDLLGTRGVSKPLRVYFDSTLLGYLKGNMASGTLPHCTGTLDKNTGQVNTTECKFRPELPLAPHPTVTKFPQLFFGPFVREGA